MDKALKFVVVGHVDHGKSTLIGRLLADTNSVMDGVLTKVKNTCQEKGIEFEYAFLLDAFQEEQEQGITIDTTKIEFSTDKRDYTIIDAPGHKEFLKNMVSGASSAEAALLIIDAKEGVREQSKKHAYILSLIGVKQIYVIINKIDLVQYSQERFNEVKFEMDAYLRKLGIEAQKFIPISAKLGDNVAMSSSNLAWYQGETVLAAIDNFTKSEEMHDKPLRVPVQDVYKFDARRIIAGRVESGSIKIGDKITLYPSLNTTTVKSIEEWKVQTESNQKKAGDCVGLTFNDEFFLQRGEVIARADEKPRVRNLLHCNFFWMGKEDLAIGKKYKLKLNTQEVECEIHTINSVVDSNTLEKIPGKHSLSKNDVGNLVIKTKQPVVFDAFSEIPTTGRFVLVDNNIVCGGGIIENTSNELQQREVVETKSELVSPKQGMVSNLEREKRQGHRGKVVWITGLLGSGKEKIAQYVERELFDKRMGVYYLDAGNIRFGLSSNLDYSEESRKEHVRRIAETANLFVQAGLIVVVSVVSPYKEHRALARQLIGENNFMEVFVDAPIEVCKQNNPHGIYSSADQGKISSVPGVNFPYERSDYLIYTLGINSSEDNLQEKAKQLVDLVCKDVTKQD